MSWPIWWISPDGEDGLMSPLRGFSFFFGFLLVMAMLAACVDRPGPAYDATFRILSGTENQPLEPIIQSFAKDQKATIEVTYAGSVDIMRELANGAQSRYDAVWPASSIWIMLGDSTNAVQLSSSIMRSPVVLGVKRSVAERLGWIDADVTVADVLAAAESGKLTFMMANAAQSDSGAAAYLGFLYAFAGQPGVLTSADLQNPAVQEKVQRILGAVSRSAGNSGSLKELFLTEYDSYDGMINYESTIIETNQTLVASGREPLSALYLRDGTSIADFPLGSIAKGDKKKDAIFQKLQSHLQSDAIQHQLLGLGRRTGIGVNPNPADVDMAVFNPDWGIDTQRILTPILIPDAAVVREALTLYQTALRKPSFTVFALDFSESMKGSGADQVGAAMHLLLDQSIAAQYILEAGPEDVTVVIPFGSTVYSVWTVTGNDPSALHQLDVQIGEVDPIGGTDIYSPIIAGLELMQEHGIDGYFASVVLLTDGKSNAGKSFDDLAAYVSTSGMGAVPVYGITFGEASRDQLREIADLTHGIVFDGSTDLPGTFRTVRGFA
jgi:Ca-activated chloride channel family protein